jgi:hypothetical protein
MGKREKSASDAQRSTPGRLAERDGSTQAAALSYAQRGWSVIPVEAGGKRPLLAWLEFQQRVAEPGEIASWFARWPDANVGIVTGQVSKLLVVDVDPQHDGIQSLVALEREHGTLPRTIEVHTGGGGRHLYFAYPPLRVPNRVGIRPGIDLRCDGGYVVAPPSVHPSGGRYRWLAGQGPEDLPAAVLPAWFLGATRAPAQGAHGLKHWRRIAHEGVTEGQRNAVLASFTGHLLWHGVDPEIVMDLMFAWNQARCRPPLADDEVARVVQSIARLHAARSADNPDAGVSAR